jgi:hypothetical protein
LKKKYSEKAVYFSLNSSLPLDFQDFVRATCAFWTPSKAKSADTSLFDFVNLYPFSQLSG